MDFFPLKRGFSSPFMSANFPQSLSVPKRFSRPPAQGRHAGKSHGLTDEEKNIFEGISVDKTLQIIYLGAWFSACLGYIL
jgi:hypothetical protein